MGGFGFEVCHGDDRKRVLVLFEQFPIGFVIQEFDDREFKRDRTPPTRRFIMIRSPGRGIVAQNGKADDFAVIAIFKAVVIPQHPFWEIGFRLTLNFDVKND